MPYSATTRIQRPATSTRTAPPCGRKPIRVSALSARSVTSALPARVVGHGEHGRVEQRVGDLGARLRAGHALTLGGVLQRQRAAADERPHDLVRNRLDRRQPRLRRQAGAPLRVRGPAGSASAAPSSHASARRRGRSHVERASVGARARRVRETSTPNGSRTSAVARPPPMRSRPARAGPDARARRNSGASSTRASREHRSSAVPLGSRRGGLRAAVGAGRRRPRRRVRRRTRAGSSRSSSVSRRGRSVSKSTVTQVVAARAAMRPSPPTGRTPRSARRTRRRAPCRSTVRAAAAPGGRRPAAGSRSRAGRSPCRWRSPRSRWKNIATRACSR